MRSGPPPSSPRPVVAVVEDDAALLNALEFALAAQGYGVCAFARAQDALDSAAIVSADCLVIDYRLPGGDGASLLRGLRRRGVACPAILITGDPGPRCRRDAAAVGARLVEKPLIGGELDAQIRRALRGSARRPPRAGRRGDRRGPGWPSPADSG